jgi:hypothetical protein
LRDDLCVRFVIIIREIHEPNAFEVEMAFEKLKRNKSPESILLRSHNTIILFEIVRKLLKTGRSPSFFPSLRKMLKQIVTITEAYHICECFSTSCCQD